MIINNNNKQLKQIQNKQKTTKNVHKIQAGKIDISGGKNKMLLFLLLLCVLNVILNTLAENVMKNYE